VFFEFRFLWKSPSKSPQICTVVISSLNSAAETSSRYMHHNSFMVHVFIAPYIDKTSLFKSNSFRLFKCFQMIKKVFQFLWKSHSKSPQICTVVISSLNSAAETSSSYLHHNSFVFNVSNKFI
jgi:hypothetical protein